MKLGLGTVQFGQDYGVSNVLGKPSLEVVRDLLAVAQSAQIKTLDTAAQYGDSEAVIGMCLPVNHRFEIVTKTPGFRSRPGIGDEEAGLVRSIFDRSLGRLGCSSIFGLLVHRAGDLLGPGGTLLFETLQQIKKSKRVQHIGVSVQDTTQLETIISRYPIDIVQLPLNVFNQSFRTSGLLERLRKTNIVVHTRSPFLQGLLLMNPARLPAYFTPIRDRLRAFHDHAARQGMTPLQAALSYALSIQEADTVLCGVAAANQLDEILVAVRRHDSLQNPEEFVVNDPMFTNPSNWPEFQ